MAKAPSQPSPCHSPILRMGRIPFVAAVLTLLAAVYAGTPAGAQTQESGSIRLPQGTTNPPAAQPQPTPEAPARAPAPPDPPPSRSPRPKPRPEPPRRPTPACSTPV